MMNGASYFGDDRESPRTNRHVVEDLRDRLGELDHQLLQLVAERQQIASEIGRRKQELGLKVRDFAQERAVIERARNRANELSVSPTLAERLMLELIRGSLAIQERVHIVGRGAPDAGRALIIGGAGRMGRWFGDFLASQGFTIDVADPAGEVEGFGYHSEWGTADIGTYEVIVVAAPIRASATILSELAEVVPPGLVFDIGSLKSPLQGALARLAEAGAKVTSIHPMFGPDTALLSGQHVIFVDVGVPEATRRARELFEATMATLVEMDLKSHDRLIGYVLGLSHALNIAFFTALSESGEVGPRLREISSTTFQAQVDVARRVAMDNPHLYYEIQSLSDFGETVLDTLAAAVERIRTAVVERNEDEFVELMERGRNYFRAQPPAAPGA